MRRFYQRCDQRCDAQTTKNYNKQLPKYRAFQIFQSMAGLGSLANLEFGNNILYSLSAQSGKLIYCWSLINERGLQCEDFKILEATTFKERSPRIVVSKYKINLKSIITFEVYNGNVKLRVSKVSIRRVCYNANVRIQGI